MKKTNISFIAFSLLITSAYAAQPVDLSKKTVNLSAFIAQPRKNLEASATQPSSLKVIRQAYDANHTLHVRFRQTYQGYEVFGADGVIHAPNQHGIKTLANLSILANQPQSSMNGILFNQLEKDLITLKAGNQSDNAMKKCEALFAKKSPTHFKLFNPKNSVSKLMVYVDDNLKAHWAYKISLPTYYSIPTFIIDATTLQVYKNWDDLQTLNYNPNTKLDLIKAGGYGGTEKTGKIKYDGSTQSTPLLDMKRDPITKNCYRVTPDVAVFKAVYHPSTLRPNLNTLSSFSCVNPDENLKQYWDKTNADVSNGAYGTTNDALLNSMIVTKMYREWYQYKLTTTADDGRGDDNEFIKTRAGLTYEPNKLKILIDDNQNRPDPEQVNAAYSSRFGKIFLLEGSDDYFPLRDLGTISHEAAHAFTDFNSNLAYMDQSGAMNESFSDMSAMASEYYLNHNNKWQIGAESAKHDETPFRYFDQPTKDCQKNGTPGENCSIDSFSQYAHLIAYIDQFQIEPEQRQSYIVHLASGVYNHMFYYLATTSGWNTKKAFDVMVQANKHYWTETSTFEQGACGAIAAAKDLKYDTNAVALAFQKVGIATEACR